MEDSRTGKGKRIWLAPSWSSTVAEAAVLPTMKVVHALLSKTGTPL